MHPPASVGPHFSCPFVFLPLDLLQFHIFPLLDSHGILALLVASPSLQDLVLSRRRFDTIFQAWHFAPPFCQRPLMEILSRLVLAGRDLNLLNVHPYRFFNLRLRVLTESTELHGSSREDIASLLKRVSPSGLDLWRGYDVALELLPTSLVRLRVSSEPKRSSFKDPFRLADLALQCPLLESLSLDLLSEPLDCRLFKNIRNVCISNIMKHRVQLIGSSTLEQVHLDCSVDDTFFVNVASNVKITRPMRRLHTGNFFGASDELFELLHDDVKHPCPYCSILVLMCCIEDHLVICLALTKRKVSDFDVICPFCVETVARSRYYAHADAHNRLSGAAPRYRQCEMGCFKRGKKCPKKIMVCLSCRADVKCDVEHTCPMLRKKVLALPLFPKCKICSVEFGKSGDYFDRYASCDCMRENK